MTASKAARDIEDKLRAIGLRYEGFVDLAHLIDALGLKSMDEALTVLAANQPNRPRRNRSTA